MAHVAPDLPGLNADDIGAIALDTSIYKRHGLRLRSQPLLSLKETQRLGIEFLVPEVWSRELRHHLEVHVGESLGITRELSRVNDWGDPEHAKLAQELHQLIVQQKPAAIAARLLSEHYQESGAVHLRTAWKSGARILDD